MAGSSRRRVLQATPGLLAAALRPGLAATPASAPPASTTSAASAVAAEPARPGLQQAGPLGPLLAHRLEHEGVALAALRRLDGRVEQGAARRGGAPPEPGSVFELGSITKTFTALLLADAVVRGELALDGAVESVLPEGLKLRDREDRPLRWRDLATHRSGLPRLPGNLAGLQAADPYAGYGWREMSAFLRGWRADRPRDAQFEYSNLGYGLLGQALGFRAGRGYPELLRERVLLPLGLEAEVGFEAALRARRLPGHDAAGRPVPPWHFEPAMAGAGALLGSPSGLRRYGEAAVGAFEHSLQAAFALCLQRQAEGPSAGQAIGLAWLLAPLAGRTLFNHDGATFGFSTSLWLDPARGAMAGVLANAAVGVADLALHLLAPEVPARDFAERAQPAQALPPEALAVLAGVYAFSPEFKLRLRVDGARLLARATGQGEFELFARAPRRFFARVTPLEIVFDGEAGPAPGLTLLQGGARMRATRE